MRKLFYIFFVGIILASCGANRLEELGNGYFLTTNARNDRAIGYNERNNTFTYAVYGHITRYAYDSKVIIAAAVSIDSLVRNATQPMFESSWPKRDKLLKDNRYERFYIIDKAKDTIFGPLIKEEYFGLRRILKVSDSLTLN